VQFEVDGETYVVEVSEITTGEHGRPTVTIYSSSISASISMNANQMFPFVPCAVSKDGGVTDPIAQGGWTIGTDGQIGAGWSAENTTALVKTPSADSLGSWPDGTLGCLQFFFDTDKPISDIIIGLYSDYAQSDYDAFLSSGVSEESSNSAKSIPEEYIGQWEGSVEDINLSFNVEPDGTGLYTFEQSGYSESHDFTLEAGTETFSVTIPAKNILGIVNIEGTYEYSDGMLILNVQTTFFNGNVFEYTVPCKRV
jgi:hypothetical protein